MMLASVTHILPLTYILRSRQLPVAGRVGVQAGQKVSASDIIARALLPSKHLVLDIRRGLGIVQVAEAEKCIVRKEGEKLSKGDVIAETGGLLSRFVRAPQEGEIISISAGQVLMCVQSTEIELKAGFSGNVAEIIPERGAVIETHGALLQGVWGNGRIDSGLLVVLAKSPDEELTRKILDVSLRGAVILAGHCSSADALQAGGELPLRGLILSSMASNLVPVASKLNYPIVVMEGFGQIPMNESAHQLLLSSEKRDASINAVVNARTGERPEIVIPLPAIGQAAPETDVFKPDQAVRIHGAPYGGKIGRLIQVRPGMATLPNGMRAPSADVQLADETRVVVPLANLDVLE